MRTLTFICFLSINLLLNAQGWRRSFGMSPYAAQYVVYPIATKDNSTFMFESTSGNYIAGAVSVTSHTTGAFLHVMGINAQGQTLWAKEYPNIIVIYGQNTRNVYVCDNYFYYISNKWSSSGNAVEGVLTKFDFNGDTVWQKTYNDTVSSINLYAITGSIDGGVFIYSPYLLIKTDSQGNELWRKQVIDTNTPYAYGVTMLQDSTSKRILIGCNTSSYGSNIYNGHSQLLICDSLGNILNTGIFSTNHGQVLDLIQTKDKNFVAVGDIDDGLDTINWIAKRKPMAVKFQIANNNAITPVWTTTYSNYGDVNEFKSVCELSDGNLLLGGTAAELGDSLQYIRFTKLRNDNGSVIWKRYYDYYTLGNNNNEAIYLYSVAPSSDGGWVAANFWHRMPPKNYRYPLTLFVKYDENGCDSTLAYCTVGIKENTANKINLSVYPNPAQEIINVESPLSPKGGTITIYVYDILGKEMLNKQVAINSGSAQINVSELNSGIYFLKVETDNRPCVMRKFIKEVRQ
ncbi:MAG: T9SS type A sorting domain-containing protein [Bacteroidetes bacterium]|nr:T9SS type A sorting domain-containing protein [Bacteroidota bacterium]